MSKAIQNELICLCGEEIVTDIISEVTESFLFWQMKSEMIVPILNKYHLFCDMFINPVKLEMNLFNFYNVNLGHLGKNLI